MKKTLSNITTRGVLIAGAIAASLALTGCGAQEDANLSASDQFKTMYFEGKNDEWSNNGLTIKLDRTAGNMTVVTSDEARCATAAKDIYDNMLWMPAIDTMEFAGQTYSASNMGSNGHDKTFWAANCKQVIADEGMATLTYNFRG